MSPSVVYSTLETISQKLERAAHLVNDSGGSAPRSVEAGEMTSLVASMISTVSESAAGLSEGMATAGSQVRDAASAYATSDDHAAQRFTMPRSR